MSNVVAFEVKPSSKVTHITLILDETGSMQSCKNATISSVNEYIATQKNDLSSECVVSLVKFSSGSFLSADASKTVRTVFSRLPLSSVKELTDNDFTPNGMTNLYDAIGVTTNQLSSADDNLVIIITDGGENSSKEYTKDSIHSLITSKQSEGWTFVYLGANQDAWQVGQAFGLSKGQTMTYSTTDMQGTMSNLSMATSTYRSMRSSGVTGTMDSFFGGEDA